MGIAFLMKQQAVFLMVFGGAALAAFAIAVSVSSYRRGEFSPRQVLRLTLYAVIYFAGAVLPYALICLWLWHAGVFEKFWFWTVTYAGQYVGEIPLSLAAESFQQNAGGIFQLNWTIWTLALVGCASLAIRGKATPGLRPFVLVFLPALSRASARGSISAPTISSPCCLAGVPQLMQMTPETLPRNQERDHLLKISLGPNLIGRSRSSGIWSVHNLPPWRTRVRRSPSPPSWGRPPRRRFRHPKHWCAAPSVPAAGPASGPNVATDRPRGMMESVTAGSP